MTSMAMPHPVSAARSGEQDARERVLYVVGAGGVGRETLDATLAAGTPVAAFLDERLAGSQIRGLPVLRPEEADSGGRFVIGIADPDARGRLAALLTGMGLRPATVVHPLAAIAPETILAAGCLVLAGVYVSSSVRLGEHTQVHYNASVGHDTVLGARVSVYPAAHVSGAVQVGDDATIGSNAVVLQGLRVGARAFVGAGAVVTRDVAPASTVVGVPARPLVRG